MKIVLRIAGILLAALGLAVGLMVQFSPGGPVEGLSFDLAAALLIGGILALGLGGVMAAVEDLRSFVAGEDQLPSVAADAKRMSRAGIAAAVPAEPAEAARPAEPMLSHARSVTAELAGETQAPPPPPPKDKVAVDKAVEDVREMNATATGEAETRSEEELYVVEERLISGKPARILSDGTVEAETDEGWMRFENFEHLKEYTEAMRARRA